jgi:hypothetical protein
MWKDKHMVETPEQGKIGIKHKAFEENDFICIKNQTYRICAPDSVDATRMQSCIFWTKNSSIDKLATWEKVVSASLIPPVHPSGKSRKNLKRLNFDLLCISPTKHE